MSVPVQLDTAAFVVSIDTEMAWGLNHRPALSYRYDREREDLQRLLELFDRHAIPATWAVVGHLMLDECEAVNGVKHPEIVRPEYEWFDGDWFADDPCTNSATDPDWYGPDLIPMIRAAQTDHEIATHGFSHIIAGDPGCSRDTFDSEMAAAVAAAANHDVALASIIHPRNRIGHLDVLGEHGIRAYRGRRDAVQPSGLVEKLVDKTLGSSRTVIRPLLEADVPNGPLVNLPATIMFDVDSRQRTWRFWVRQVERRLQQAVDHQSLFHIWFHPHNLRDNPDASFAALEHICAAAARHRDAGDLQTITMAGMADEVVGAA